MLRASFEQLHEAGCIQTGADMFDTVEKARPQFEQMFAGLMFATRLDPCTTGCAAFDNGKCLAYVKYHSVPVNERRTRDARVIRATTAPTGESVSQIAKRLGISKNEVRRRKQAGTL